MSIRVMTRVWDQASVAGGELLVLLALADFADDEGYCYPKEQQIATKARLSDRQVRTVIKSLAARGELAYQTGRGRNARSWYVVLSGLPEDTKAARVAALQDREIRKQVPDKTSAISPKSRKPLPEETSAFPAKTGSLSHLKPEVCDISTGDLQHSDGSNAPPNRHVIRHDRSGGGGARAREAVLPEHRPAYEALLAAGVFDDTARELAPVADLDQIAYLASTAQRRADDPGAWIAAGVRAGRRRPTPRKEQDRDERPERPGMAAPGRRAAGPAEPPAGLKRARVSPAPAPDS